MATGRCNTVTALLEVQPELKITEFSTQYDRDALLDITERPKLSEGTETVEDALFGTEDRRPSASCLNHPGSNPGHSGRQANQNLT